jgi:hypothetical protein
MGETNTLTAYKSKYLPVLGHQHARRGTRAYPRDSAIPQPKPKFRKKTRQNFMMLSVSLLRRKSYVKSRLASTMAQQVGRGKGAEERHNVQVHTRWPPLGRSKVGVNPPSQHNLLHSKKGLTDLSNIVHPRCQSRCCDGT